MGNFRPDLSNPDEALALVFGAMLEGGFSYDEADRLGIVLAPGDGMEPTIMNRAPVLFEPVEAITVSGAIYVIRLDRLNGEALTAPVLNRVYRREGGGYVLAKDNRCYPDDEVLLPTGETTPDGRCVLRSTMGGNAFCLDVVGRVVYPTTTRRARSERLPASQLREMVEQARARR